MDEKKKELHKDFLRWFGGVTGVTSVDIIDDFLWPWIEEQDEKQREEFVKDLEEAHCIGLAQGSAQMRPGLGYVVRLFSEKFDKLISKYKKNEE